MAEEDIARSAQKARDISSLRRLLRSGQARLIRLDTGLSQGEIARLLSVSPAAVSRWESGTRVPRGEVALRYFELLRALRT